MALGGPRHEGECILPYGRKVVKLDAPTRAEHRSLLQCRLACLSEATAKRNGGTPLDVNDRVGWRARINVLGRDQDRSLLASVTVTDPAGAIVMLRNVRLVRERRLYV